MFGDLFKKNAKPADTSRGKYEIGDDAAAAPQSNSADELVEVTVAPGKSIGKPANAVGPGGRLKVTPDEAARLKKTGFIV